MDNKEKSKLPIKVKKGDKVIIVSPMFQTCIAEFVEEDKNSYLVKNPILFAAFPERDKDNPNTVRTRIQAPCVWNRGIMADINVPQLVAFPKASYGIMVADDVTNDALFSTDTNRIYSGTWGKVETDK